MATMTLQGASRRKTGFRTKPSVLLRGFLLFFLLSFLLYSCPSAPAGNGNGNGGNGDITITTIPLSPNAQRLMNYLSDQYGDYIISGQMDTAWTENASMDMIARVYEDTGKYPALKGFDLIDLPNSWSGYGKNQINEAIEWWEGKNRNKGAAAVKLLPAQPDVHGIVAFCWHWRMANKEAGKGPDFYTNNTNFRIPYSGGKLDTASAAFQTIKSDLDKAAALLKLLKDRDIPVLWRPLHEASGGWFWWGANTASGASGSAACGALWEYMYDYLANVKGLDNLIWVWNGQNPAWFPNPDTVHIISFDVYMDNTNTAQAAQNATSSKFTVKFTETKNTPPAKNLMVALSENGVIPDPDFCAGNNSMWSWFMTWNDDYGSTQGQTDKGNFWTGNYHNTAAHKNHVFNHEKVITLDELPDLSQYRRE